MLRTITPELTTGETVAAPELEAIATMVVKEPLPQFEMPDPALYVKPVPAITPTVIAARLIVEGAYALIEEGWTQGAYRSGDTFCSIGAVNLASGKFAPGNGAAHNMALNAIRAQLPERYRTVGGDLGIIRFNDAGGTRHADVTRVFSKALDSLS